MTKVELTTHVSYNGTFYHPREYNVDELPEAVIASPACKPVKGSPQVETHIKPTGSFEPSEVKLTVESEPITPSKYPTTTTIIDPKGEVTTTLRLQVNQALADDLAKLKGVTQAIALKVVQERQTQKFNSLGDLDQRVPIKGGWDKLKDSLLFD